MLVKKRVEKIEGVQGAWEAEGTRFHLTFSPADGGGWDLVLPHMGWLGRVYTPGIRTAVDLGAPDRVHLQTRAGELGAVDRKVVEQICMSLLPELDALEADR